MLFLDGMYYVILGHTVGGNAVTARGGVGSISVPQSDTVKDTTNVDCLTFKWRL